MAIEVAVSAFYEGTDLWENRVDSEPKAMTEFGGENCVDAMGFPI